MPVSAPAPRQKLRVLVLEDSQTDAEILIRELRQAGLDPDWTRVESESTFLAGLNLSPDVILSDYALPQFDGMMALDLVRARGLDTPFLLISGVVGEEIGVAAIKLGADDYLLKDRMRRLGPAVTQALESKRLRDERRRTEEALRTSQQQLAAIYANAPDVIFYLAVEADGSFRFVSVNKTFLEITGLAEDQVVGKLVQEVIPEPSLSVVLSNYREAIQTKVTVQWEEDTDFPTGRKHGSVAVAPILDETGKCTHLVGSVRDLTELHESRSALAASEERYALVERAVNDGIWDWDVLTHKDYLSPRWKAILGFADHELPNVEASFFERVHPDDNQLIQKAMNETERFAVELRLRHKDGNYRWVLCRGDTILGTDGHPVRVVGSITDITERKQAERALQDSEQRFRAIIDYAPVGVAMVEIATGRLLTANEQFCNIIGCTQQELTATTFMAMTHPDDLPESAKSMELLKTGQIRHFTIDQRYLCPGGSVVWCNVTVSALWRPNESPTFGIAVVKCITEERLAQLERQQHQAELAHVARISVAGEMVSGIAHELNQPLTSIVNFADASQAGLKAKTIDVDHQLRLTAKIMEQAQRAGQIIRRLRDLVRRSEPKRSSIDLREAIEQTLSFLENDSYLQGVQLASVVPDTVPMVVGDLILIEQVLLNLVRNAIEAQLNQTDAPKEVMIEVTANLKDAVEIIVADNGNAEGIDDPEQFFSPFFTTKPGGMGLGLPISRSIAEAHQGTLSAKKRPTRGIEFRLLLPVGRAV